MKIKKMKIIVITSALLFALCSYSSAQDFVKGGNYASLGFVVDPFGNNIVGGNNVALGAVLAYDRGITDVLGIGRIGAGGIIGFSSYQTSSASIFIATTKYRRTRIAVMARATYHFEFDIDKLDVYAGVAGGMYYNIDTDETSIFGETVKTNNNDVTPAYYLFGGVRYYFTDLFGVYLEIGEGFALVSAGIVLSF